MQMKDISDNCKNVLEKILQSIIQEDILVNQLVIKTRDYSEIDVIDIDKAYLPTGKKITISINFENL